MLGTGLSFAAPQHETLYLEVGNDIEVPVERYGNADGMRLLWIPSEYGYATNRYRTFFEKVSAAGFEVWQLRLHEAYFLPTGRKSLSDMPVEDVAELIEQAVPDDGRKLIIMSAGRGAALSFMALRSWLADEGQHDALAGVLLLHPNFMASTPEPGKPVEYLSIIKEVALPVYIFQPLGSAKRWYLSELTEQLVSTGSHVYTHALDGVRDGFQGHPEATESEISFAYNRLPAIFWYASERLAADEFQSHVVAMDKDKGDVGWSIKPIQARLQNFPGAPPAPDLSLETVEGGAVSLKDYRGRVVLINFWATWCPPCVEEIPSLGRLQQKFLKDELTVISVDVGEEKARVQEFLKRVPARYPVMLDPGGMTVSDWKLRAFPTTFVIDTQGRISLAYFGGLEWDSPEIVEQLQGLLGQ
jgi:thiol-disulfide isomerase/thioredoxin